MRSGHDIHIACRLKLPSQITPWCTRRHWAHIHAGKVPGKAVLPAVAVARGQIAIRLKRGACHSQTQHKTFELHEAGTDI